MSHAWLLPLFDVDAFVDEYRGAACEYMKDIGLRPVFTPGFKESLCSAHKAWCSDLTGQWHGWPRDNGGRTLLLRSIILLGWHVKDMHRWPYAMDEEDPRKSLHIPLRLRAAAMSDLGSYVNLLFCARQCMRFEILLTTGRHADSHEIVCDPNMIADVLTHWRPPAVHTLENFAQDIQAIANIRYADRIKMN